MRKNKWMVSLLLFISLFCMINSSYALPYKILPKAGTVLPTQLILGNQVKAFYTVTNITNRIVPVGFVKYLPPSVAQVTVDNAYPDLCKETFTLAPGASCTLELVITGGVNSQDPNPRHHLFVCSPKVPACAGTTYPLNVHALTPTIRGVVQSGGNASSFPLINAEVKIYRADLTSATQIGEAITNSTGNFYIYIPPSAMAGASSFYAIARYRNNITLATIIGSTMQPLITINELTTVAAAFSMAQFFHNDTIFGKTLGLQIASGMNDNLVSPVTGNLSSVIMTSPNADQTNTRRSLNNLANLIGSCVRNTSACAPLFALTTVNLVVPDNTLDALLSIAHNPDHNVNLLFVQSNTLAAYQPSLVTPPDAWTLAVKFNNSGNLAYMFGGPAKTVFDKKGYAWISNNVIQGTPDSSNWIVVLKPNGQPADGKNGTPISPVFGGGLLGTAFGISIDHNGSIWVGNFGWGSCPTCIPIAGSVSQFSPTGIPISGPSGYTTDSLQVQGTVPDQNNNIWMASYGNNRVVVYLHGDPNNALFYQEPALSGPFDMVIAPDGSGWVTNTLSGMVSRYIIVGNSLQQTFNVSVGSGVKGMAFDSQGNAWVAATGDSKVYLLNSAGAVIGSYNGGGVAGPWGITVDGDDNVWVANFEDTNPLRFSVSKLCGINPANCPTGLTTGDPISPATGYTLPSAGSEVLLADGTPLNGSGGPPSFNPLMRLTHAISDQAGNVWCANNWKPLPYAPGYFNPGGDGMVVFIGLATPPH